MVTRRDFLGILTSAAAAIAVPELVIPRRTFFLPPFGGWGPIPFKEPSPELFKLLGEIERAADEVCAVTEFWYREPFPDGSGARPIYVQSRIHYPDRPGILLTKGMWPHLQVPFV